jgi:hypothetical protein
VIIECYFSPFRWQLLCVLDLRLSFEVICLYEFSTKATAEELAIENHPFEIDFDYHLSMKAPIKEYDLL